MNLEKVFANDVTDKGLISKICKSYHSVTKIKQPNWLNDQKT